MSPTETIELTGESKALLKHERVNEAVPEGSSQRVLGRLTATLGLAPLAGATVLLAPSASAQVASGVLGGLKAKLLVVALALGSLVGVGGLLRGAVPVPSTAKPAAVARLAPITQAARPEAAPTALPALPSALPAPSTRSAVALRPEVDDRPSPPSLAEERGLLDGARQALAGGNGRGALQALTAHERRFPRGRLVEERESLVVQALAHAAGPEAARQRFAAFRRRFPRSIFLPALQAVVDSLP